MNLGCPAGCCAPLAADIPTSSAETRSLHVAAVWLAKLLLLMLNNQHLHLLMELKLQPKMEKGTQRCLPKPLNQQNLPLLLRLNLNQLNLSPLKVSPLSASVSPQVVSPRGSGKTGLQVILTLSVLQGPANG